MTCSACRYENPPASAFCEECGARVITIVFADLIGSTSLHEVGEQRGVDLGRALVRGDVAVRYALHLVHLERPRDGVRDPALPDAVAAEVRFTFDPNIIGQQDVLDFTRRGRLETGV